MQTEAKFEILTQFDFFQKRCLLFIRYYQIHNLELTKGKKNNYKIILKRKLYFSGKFNIFF